MGDLRVLGLDLSLTATGVADLDGELQTLRHKASEGDHRLVYLQEQIAELTPLADLAVVEDLPTHAHGAGITGMVHGIARAELIKASVPYLLVPAATLKVYATGRGNATKPDMRMELYRRAGIDERDDNRVDAWWLRALGHDLAGQPLIDLPQTHRRALTKLALPEPRTTTDG